MEKKEMSFSEKAKAAGEELEKAMVESNKDAMIMIATSEEIDEGGVSVSIKGEPVELSILLACVAIKNKGFKMILMDAIKFEELYNKVFL